MPARHFLTDAERDVLRHAALILRRAAQVHSSRASDPDFHLPINVELNERQKCLTGAEMAEHLALVATDPSTLR